MLETPTFSPLQIRSYESYTLRDGGSQLQAMSRRIHQPTGCSGRKTWASIALMNACLSRGGRSRRDLETFLPRGTEPSTSPQHFLAAHLMAKLLSTPDQRSWRPNCEQRTGGSRVGCRSSRYESAAEGWAGAEQEGRPGGRKSSGSVQGGGRVRGNDFGEGVVQSP